MKIISKELTDIFQNLVDNLLNSARTLVTLALVGC